MENAIDIPSLVDPNAPGVTDGEIIDELAYYAYRAPKMPDYMIEWKYADSKDIGHRGLMAIFKAEGDRRGIEIKPIPDAAVYRDGRWQSLISD